MGPVGDQKEDRDCAVNFVFTKDGHVTQGNLLRDVVSRERISEETKKLKDENETVQQFGSRECEPRFHVNIVQSEDDNVPTVNNEPPTWTVNIVQSEDDNVPTVNNGPPT